MPPRQTMRLRKFWGFGVGGVLAACLWAGMGFYMQNQDNHLHKQAEDELSVFLELQANMMVAMQLQRRLASKAYNTVHTPEVLSQEWVERSASAIFASQASGFSTLRGVVLYETVSNTTEDKQRWAEFWGKHAENITSSAKENGTMHLVSAAWPQAVADLVGLDVVPLRGAATSQLVHHPWSVTNVTELVTVQGQAAFLYYATLPFFGRHHASGMPRYFVSVSGGFAIVQQDGYKIELCMDAGCHRVTTLQHCPRADPMSDLAGEQQLMGFSPHVQWVLRVCMCRSFYDRINNQAVRIIIAISLSLLGVLIWAAMSSTVWVFEQRFAHRISEVKWHAARKALYDMLQIMFHRLGTPLDALMMACVEYQEDATAPRHDHTSDDAKRNMPRKAAGRRRPSSISIPSISKLPSDPTLPTWTRARQLAKYGEGMQTYMHMDGRTRSSPLSSIETTSVTSESTSGHLLRAGTLQLHEIHSMLGAVNNGIQSVHESGVPPLPWDVSWLAFACVSKHSLALEPTQQLRLMVQAVPGTVCVKHRMVQFILDQGIQNAIIHGASTGEICVQVYTSQGWLWVDVWNAAAAAGPSNIYIDTSLNGQKAPRVSGTVRSHTYIWNAESPSEVERSGGSMTYSSSCTSTEEALHLEEAASSAMPSHTLGFGLSSCRSLAASGACTLRVGYQASVSKMLFRAGFPCCTHMRHESMAEEHVCSGECVDVPTVHPQNMKVPDMMVVSTYKRERAPSASQRKEKLCSAPENNNWFRWIKESGKHKSVGRMHSFQKLWVTTKSWKVLLLQSKPKVSIPLGLLQGQCVYAQYMPVLFLENSFLEVYTPPSPRRPWFGTAFWKHSQTTTLDIGNAVIPGMMGEDGVINIPIEGGGGGAASTAARVQSDEMAVLAAVAPDMSVQTSSSVISPPPPQDLVISSSTSRCADSGDVTAV